MNKDKLASSREEFHPKVVWVIVHSYVRQLKEASLFQNSSEFHFKFWGLGLDTYADLCTLIDEGSFPRNSAHAPDFILVFLGVNDIREQVDVRQTKQACRIFFYKLINSYPEQDFSELK